MNRHAFTLIELLVVICIIGVLALMLLPARSMVRGSAQSTLCASNQRQITVAVLSYVYDHDDMLPYSFGPIPGNIGPLSWCVRDNLGQYLDITSPTVPWNAALGGSDIRMMQGASRVLRCPTRSTVGAAAISYGLESRFCCDNTDLNSTGSAAAYPPRMLCSLNALSSCAVITDTAGDPRWTGFWSNPVMVFGNGKVNQNPSWTTGYPYLQPFLVMPRHRSGCNIGFLDGHVAFSPNPAIEDIAGSIILR